MKHRWKWTDTERVIRVAIIGAVSAALAEKIDVKCVRCGLAGADLVAHAKANTLGEIEKCPGKVAA